MNNKIDMKICHMTSVHSAKDARIFYKECTSLAKAGYNVILVVAGAQDEICNDVKIIGVPTESKGRLNRMLNDGMKVYKKALKVNADIYHIHDPELLPYALMLKKKGKKVIFDSHEFYGEQILCKPYLPKSIRKIVSVLYKIIEGYICKRIDYVIQICTINGRNYFEGRSKKTVFITNAPILNDEIIPVKNLTERLNKVVLVGTLSEARGITKLAQAIIKTSCKLVLAGPFSSYEYEKKIKQICGDKLDYKGTIPANEIPSLIKECGIGVSIFRRVGQYDSIDTLPTKNYDYMFGGLPTIMSDFPYLLRFNKLNNVGINVDAEDTDSIADAINYLATHPDEANLMGKNGMTLTRNKLNWGIEEKKLLDLYASLL